jgi:hypothetical protein
MPVHAMRATGVRRRLLLCALCALCALLYGAPSAHAQLPADARWHTIESQHFRVTYEDGLELLARRAAASAERAHAALGVLVAGAPRGVIDIVVADNADFSNGYATPFPSNRIVVYAKPPVDVLELQYMHDWIDLVIVHELAHIFHLDVAGWLGRAVRTVFGRMPAPWPVFPAVLSPTWTIEGLAVGIESALSGFGRVHGSYHEMVVRTDALDGGVDAFDRLASGSPVWPGPARVYIHGSLFMDYLAERFGPDATARIVRSTAGALLPPPVWFNGVGRAALGVTFRQAYDDWRTEMEARAATLRDELLARGVTAGTPLTAHGGWAMHPRFAPDSRHIAYSANDGRGPPALRVIDAASGESAWTERTNGISAASWLPDGSVLFSQLDFVDPLRIYSDLSIAGPRGARPVTRGGRLQDPDVAPDGAAAVAVENDGGTNRLVVVDLATGTVRPLTDLDPGVHWALPRFAPGGRHIAAGRWSAGGDYDVVVLDTSGRIVLQVTAEPGISAAPAWAPDGRWLLFWSDRTGIPNVYAADVGALLAVPANTSPGGTPQSRLRPVLRQVTNVLTGAYQPDVSPDGRWIAFAAYGPDGFRVERIAFDTASWRAPLPAGHAVARHEHDGHGAEPAAAAFMSTIAAAAATADTAAGPAGRYRALRHVRPYGWLPLARSERARGAQPWSVGIGLFGQDIVERHHWDLSVLLQPGSGRTAGAAGYTWRGLPPIRPLGVHPTLGIRVVRDWDEVIRDDVGGRFADEREDRAEVTLALTHLRMRRAAGLAVGAEAVRRSRHLFGTGWQPGTRLIDPTDDLFGVRASAILATATRPRFGFSREDGVSLQVAGRHRMDRNPVRASIDGESVVIDRSYTELTTWNAGYLALPLPGFARHVLAARASGLARTGPGASTTSIGGTSTQPVWLPGLGQDLAGSGRLLPVRGFDAGVRRGTYAWTASAEYRFPVALVTRPLPLLPLFLDRVSGAAFADAGHAWCRPAAHPMECSTSATDPPLVSAGAELTTLLGIYEATLPLRFGIALPLQGPTRSAARFHIVAGASF